MPEKKELSRNDLALKLFEDKIPFDANWTDEQLRERLKTGNKEKEEESLKLKNISETKETVKDLSKRLDETNQIVLALSDELKELKTPIKIAPETLSETSIASTLKTRPTPTVPASEKAPIETKK